MISGNSEAGASILPENCEHIFLSTTYIVMSAKFQVFNSTVYPVVKVLTTFDKGIS